MRPEVPARSRRASGFGELVSAKPDAAVLDPPRDPVPAKVVPRDRRVLERRNAFVVVADAREMRAFHNRLFDALETIEEPRFLDHLASNRAAASDGRRR